MSHPNDIVIVSALRTPFTRAGRGPLRQVPAANLLHAVLTATLTRTHINPALIEDIAVGNVLSPGAGATEFRAAALAAGLPVTTACRSVNRQCSSGLQACVDIALAIRAGMIDVGIGAGVESMSMNYGPGAVGDFSELLENHEEAANCRVPMGVLSEAMAKDRMIERTIQDAFAAESHRRAEHAQKEGWFEQEIVPVAVNIEDAKTGEVVELEVLKDDGIRPGSTVESLGRIRAAFAEQGEQGNITAGNASQVTDGAAAVLMMKRSTAEKLGQKILGKFVCASVVGVPPLLMGVGPEFAIPQVLKQAGITKDEVDVFEINEAFASQCVWCVEQLGLDPAKVNPVGGAIAIGHPLGCTGARQIGTILNELRRRKRRIGITSMCVGTGMGMAAVFVAEE